MKQHLDRGRRAFSLVELLVVIAIATVLMAIVVGSFAKVNHYHRRSETMGRMRTLAIALQAYRDDWGDVPPYNPTHADFNGDGSVGPANEPHHMGLWALYMLDYINNYRVLTDSAADIDLPWFLDGSGARVEVVPGDAASLEAAYLALTGTPIQSPGGDLTVHEEARVYTALANPAWHNAGGQLPTDHGDFAGYDDLTYDNYCSWMMFDPYSQEWKYQPVRRNAPLGTAETMDGTQFPVDDPTNPDYYHRQLSHKWTDHDLSSYLPASATVVTWSNLFRQSERRPAFGLGDWGYDFVLYADGHVAAVPGPYGPVTVDPSYGRAVQRPEPR